MNQSNKRELLLETRKLKKFFPLKKKSIFQRKKLFIRALDDISLTIHKGETLGIVGESGCGKSTLGRVILQLYEPTSGSALYYGVPLREANPSYVLDEIKKLPKYQAKAKKAYDKSLVIDKKIEELKELIKNEDQNAKETLQSEFKKIHEAKVAELKASEKEAVNNTINTLKEGVVEYKKLISKNPNLFVEKNWEKEVNKVIGFLEYESDQVGVEDYISLLHMPHKKVETAYKEVLKVRKEIEKENKKFESLAISKTDRQLKRLNHKSKELKKEASRQLREGSRTGGVYILEANLDIISELMLKEELLHREIFNNEKRIKDLKKLIERKENSTRELTDSEKEKNVEIIKDSKEEIKKLEKENVEGRIRQDKLLTELKSYKFKEVLPITERCLDPEYQQKMEDNREYAINLQKLNKHELRVLRQKLQIIFQDPYSSLDTRMTVGQAISEAVVEHGLFKKGSPELEEYIIDIMAKCGLDHYMIHRYPHQFSGGQRQRIVIARALALNPEFVVCDESVSALDVSIQSQILNLLEDLKEKNNLTYLFISHDLSVIKHISDRIGVMYLGDLVELCEAEELYNNSLHPYSKALISAIPTTTQGEKKRIILEGDIPSNIFPPSGCKFRTRCPLAREHCAKVAPELREVEPGHKVACHFYEETKTLV